MPTAACARPTTRRPFEFESSFWIFTFRDIFSLLFSQDFPFEKDEARWLFSTSFRTTLKTWRATLFWAESDSWLPGNLQAKSLHSRFFKAQQKRNVGEFVELAPAFFTHAQSFRVFLHAQVFHKGNWCHIFCTFSKNFNPFSKRFHKELTWCGTHLRQAEIWSLSK